MKRLLFLFAFSVFFSTGDSNASDSGASGSGKPFQICFFELDNTTTSTNFKGQKIANAEVQVFKPEGWGGDTAQAFKNMIEATQNSGKACDSLVVSGHHTGNWYGKQGSLKLKHLEALSCDPKYRDWFSNIQALWLDGCNTVTDNAIASIESTPPSPDAETVRVVGKEQAHQAINKGHITSTSQAYSLSLDKNTPLSSRYLRMFPNTKIFGFNGAAPLGGEEKNQAGNRSFIAEHLSQLGQALNAIDDNAKELAQKQKIQLGLEAIFSQEYCDEQQEAWEKVGKESGLKPEAIENLYYEEYKLGCDLTLAKQLLDNPNSREAQIALAQKIKDSGYRGGGILNLANEILKNPDSKDSAIKLAKQLIKRSLGKIIKEDSELGRADNKLSLSHLLFNNIYDTWSTAKRYQTSDSEFFNSVKKQLQDDRLTNTLRTRVESSQTSSLRKADYIKFYTELKGDKPEWMNKAITDLIAKASDLFPDLKSTRESNLPLKPRRALSLSVVDQLLQYDLLSEEQIQSIRDSAIFKDKTSDFSLNVFMSFQIASGRDSLDKILEGQSSKGRYKTFAVKALTRHHINSPANMDTLIMSSSSDTQDLTELLNEIDIQISYKKPQEQINILSNHINQSQDQQIKSFFSLYAKDLYDRNLLTSDEKKQLCSKIITEEHKKQLNCS